MNKFLFSRAALGVLLIAGGVLLLIDALVDLPYLSLFWAAAFLLGSLYLLGFFITNRANWWALIPGIILLGLAVTVTVPVVLPGFPGEWIGAIFLSGISLSFLAVFLADRQQWWALIPFGVLATLATVVVFSNSTNPAATGGLFFLGLGLTFALIAFLPGPQGQMRWAWIPAGILGIMGILIYSAAAHLINYVWPTFLILFGLYVLYRAFRPRPDRSAQNE